MNSKQNSNQGLYNFCDQFCIINLIDMPTRLTQASGSFPGVIYFCVTDRFSASGMLHHGTGDHYVFMLGENRNFPSQNQNYVA